MIPQSANAQLVHRNDKLTEEKAALTKDVNGQRDLMARALEQLAGHDNRGAMATLKAGLDYRNAQRTPRRIKT